VEILAAIACLESLTEPCDIEIHSDSRYVVNAIEQGCAALWRSNGWKRNKEEHALNPDPWERRRNLLPKHNGRLTWLRGHADHEENEKKTSAPTNSP